jgi:symplekin
MSLYADEDLPNVPSESTSSFQTESSIPADPGHALSQALSLPAESVEQAQALQTAAERFETNPQKLPELCTRLLPMVVEGGESLLRSWTLEMVGLAVGRGELGEEVKLSGQFSIALPMI